MRLPLLFAAAASLAMLASPSLAHDHENHGDDAVPQWKADRYAPPPAGAQPMMMEPQARDAWLAECRHRLGARDRGIGGAVIGGAVGGLAGSRIAGRGNRTEGAIAGAAVGAIAGAVIDKAEDRGRNRDECEAYLDDYYAQYRAPHGQAGYGYGYGNNYPAYSYPAGGCCNPQPMMMVPVMMVPVAKPECTETVEYVTEYVPVRTPAKRIIRDKRIKLVPDKRTKLK